MYEKSFLNSILHLKTMFENIFLYFFFLPHPLLSHGSRLFLPESPFVGMRVFNICSKSTFAFDQYQHNSCSVFLFLKSFVHGGSTGSLGGYWKVLDEEIAADTTERNVTLSPSRFAERQAEGPPLSTKNLSSIIFKLPQTRKLFIDCSGVLSGLYSS